MRKVAWILAAGLLVAGVAVWFSHHRVMAQTAQTLLSAEGSFVDNGTVAVRVNKVEMARELPDGLSRMPPDWIRWSPLLLRGWALVFQKTKQVRKGLVWVDVEAAISTDQPLELSEIEYRLDYGTYTMGTSGGRIAAAPGRRYTVGTRFEVTDGPVPTALEISVKGEWLRFPLVAR